MANPSPGAIAAIRARVPAPDWAAKSDAEVLAALEADAIANPTPQGTVPHPVADSELLGLLSPESLKALREHVNFKLIKDDIERSNRFGIGKWALVFGPLLNGPLTSDEAGAIIAYVQQTDPDPSWAATIPAIVAEIGRPIDLDDVAASRPGA